MSENNDGSTVRPRQHMANERTFLAWLRTSLVVIGLGLIGGSLARDLKKRIGYEVFGMDQDPAHIKKALELGLKILTEKNFADLLAGNDDNKKNQQFSMF